jgi:RasGEF N-terminal motif
MPQHAKEVPPAPSPFEDYQNYPFHWTGESMRDSPVNPIQSSPLDRSALIAQFPMIQTSQLEQSLPPKSPDSEKPTIRKRRFRQLRRAMSLTHIRHKPTPPDTAPPTPTVPNQVPSSSVGVQSLESLIHWQLPDPTAPPASLDSNLIRWPSTLVQNPASLRASYEPPLDQLSPPSSIPSESDILPRDSYIGLGTDGLSSRLSLSPSLPSAQSPSTLYPPTIYDAINLSDPAVLEKNANGKVLAGTVEGLVAYITSPDCLDYDVLSDFFMMYRKFMEPSKLLGLLFSRFEWGLIRGVVVKPPDNEGTFYNIQN